MRNKKTYDLAAAMDQFLNPTSVTKNASNKAVEEALYSLNKAAEILEVMGAYGVSEIVTKMMEHIPHVEPENILNDDSYRSVFERPRIKMASAEEDLVVEPEKLQNTVESAYEQLLEASKILDELGLVKSAELALSAVETLISEAQPKEKKSDLLKGGQWPGQELEKEKTGRIVDGSGNQVWPEEGWVTASEAHQKLADMILSNPSAATYKVEEK